MDRNLVTSAFEHTSEGWRNATRADRQPIRLDTYTRPGGLTPEMLDRVVAAKDRARHAREDARAALG